MKQDEAVKLASMLHERLARDAGGLKTNFYDLSSQRQATYIAAVTMLVKDIEKGYSHATRVHDIRLRGDAVVPGTRGSEA